MVQRLHNVDKWTTIEEGQSLAFLNGRERNVRLHVNTPSEVEVNYICQKTGQVHFLALVKGLDVLEFGTVGPFEITVKGGFLNVFTNDGDDVSVAPTASEAFVEIMERRQRNPLLEQMMWEMNQNLERRLEMQANELAARYEARLAELAESNAGDAGEEPAPTGAAGGAGEVPASDGSGTGNET